MDMRMVTGMIAAVLLGGGTPALAQLVFVSRESLVRLVEVSTFRPSGTSSESSDERRDTSFAPFSAALSVRFGSAEQSSSLSSEMISVRMASSGGAFATNSTTTSVSPTSSFVVTFDVTSTTGIVLFGTLSARLDPRAPSVRLSGPNTLDESWAQADATRSFTFARNLPPGRYVLDVQCGFNTGTGTTEATLVVMQPGRRTPGRTQAALCVRSMRSGPGRQIVYVPCDPTLRLPPPSPSPARRRRSRTRCVHRRV